MTGLLCVGGSHDGDTQVASPQSIKHVFGETQETYLRVEFKGEGECFMLAGMKPVDALKRWRELRR